MRAARFHKIQPVLAVLIILISVSQAAAITVTKMIADMERPFIYAIATDYGDQPDSLLIIDVETEQMVKSLPMGTAITDMAINYGEGRLYVTNWRSPHTQVVDLESQSLLPPLALGTDVYKINAGRPGRIYYEEEDQWINIHIVNTATGLKIGSYFMREGDGEVDPTGNYYYHCDNNSSAARITKIDVSTDSPVSVAFSLRHPFGSRNLLMSEDGSRLFWRGYVYDADLNELGYLGQEIYATSLQGDVAFGSMAVFNAHTGDVIYTLPGSFTVQALSGNQEKLFLYNSGTQRIEVVPMSKIAEAPPPGLDPVPANTATVSLPVETLSWETIPTALRYQVYFGESAVGVEAADTTSPEFLGNVFDDNIPLTQSLDFRRTYYWRVDLVGFGQTTVGDVWSFTVAPIVVSPKKLITTTIFGAADFNVDLALTADGSTERWEVSESIPWLELDQTNGTTPDSITANISTHGMSLGIYQDTLWVTAGSYNFVIPVELEVIELELSQMVTDHEREYIYGLDRGSDTLDDAFLIFINTETEQVERVLPIGSNPTDMSINYGEGRLYVTNWLRPHTQVVDLETQALLPMLDLGTNVYKINAGRPGRIYYEEEDQWVNIHIVNTATGSHVGSFFMREGDGEVDPTGNYYYHCDNNISNAHITRFDISTDSPVSDATSLEHAYGSRNLVMSPDGSRLFWRGYVYDADLNELGRLGREIYATSLHGDLAFGSKDVLNVHTGDVIYTLSDSFTVQALSADQEKLFLYNSNAHQLDVIPMSDIADIPAPGLNPVPADTATVSLPLDTLFWDISSNALRYQVYFGESESGVEAADTTSSEFLGSVLENRVHLAQSLDLGRTYYWRVDLVGFSQTTIGDVWSFTVAPIIVSPKHLGIPAILEAADFKVDLALTAKGNIEPWEISESIPWLELDRSYGTTPDAIVAIVSTRGMSTGTYQDSLLVISANYSFVLPVELEVINLELSQMVTDYERDYIYGLDRGTGNFNDAFLVFINTKTDQIDRVLPIGSNPTDMTINYGEGKLYVTNWLRPYTQVVDLETQTLLPPLALGPDVYKINAGRPGRIYYEQEDQWIYIVTIDTETGLPVGGVGGPFVREGDGEVDPTGDFYYHCDNNISNAHISKFDIAQETSSEVANSTQHSFGSRNLVLSRDGSRLFWRGYVYDQDLNELRYLGMEVHATSLHGDLALGSSLILDANTGDTVYSLPVSSEVLAISGDQKKLFQYNEGSHELFVTSMYVILGKKLTVAIDILPGSCTNSLSDSGLTGNEAAVLSTAILGFDDFNVNGILPESVELTGVKPVRWSYDDVSWPANKTKDSCACNHGGEDGFVDLVLEFDLQEVLESLTPLPPGKQGRALSHSGLPREPSQDEATDAGEPLRNTTILSVRGQLKDGTTIEGYDCVQLLTDMSVSAIPIGDTLQEVALFGNHPNPFNPTTSIGFYLPEAARVKIEIFNILGQRVATLVDGNMDAGDHRVEWDGSGAASGIYLYRFEVANRVESGKMILLK